MGNPIIEEIARVAAQAITARALDKNSAVPAEAARPDVKQEITAEIMIQAKDNPVVAYAANMEPWYQSRVITGLIASIIGAVFALLGKKILPEQMEQLNQIISQGLLFGGQLWALYGRTLAKKPIGS